MTVTSNIPRRSRTGILILPVIMIGGALAASLLVLGDIRSTVYSTADLDRAQISDVQFVNTPDSTESLALQDAIGRACARTGCETKTIHPMIVASAERMTRAELERALAAQARLLAEGQSTRQRALPGTDLADLSALEILAAERITALYEAELAQR